MQPIVKGIDIKGIGYGLVGVAIGLGLLYAGLTMDVTLAIGRLALPKWSIYGAGTVIALGGALLAAMSLKTEKCGPCGATLEHGEAHFPPEASAMVMGALQHLDPRALQGLPMVPEQPHRATVQMRFCPDCGQVGELSARQYQGVQEHQLIAPGVVTGPAVEGIAEVVQAHVSWRGEDE